VTGAQASGKSTIAELLAQHVERGVHVRGGQFYRWAVRGWVHVGDADEAEARRLLDLRYRLSASVADEYPLPASPRLCRTTSTAPMSSGGSTW
jgi:cytidylate kinase